MTAALPWLPLAGWLAAALAFAVAARRAGLGRRPVLVGAMVLAALPALYVALIWARLVPESYLRLGRPWAVLLPAATMAAVALRLAAARAAAGSSRLGDALLGATVLAAGLAAAAPELGRPLDRLAVVVVVDRSRSVDLVPHADERVSRELRIAEESMEPGDRIGTVVFGAAAATEDSPRPRSQLAAAQRVQVPRDGTDLEAGIRRALTELPADAAGRLVLVSDGVPTRGDVMAAAGAAVAAQIPVDVVLLEQRERPDVRVVALRAPPRAAEGESLRLRLVVASPRETEVEVRLRRDGELVQRHRVRVHAGEDVIDLTERVERSGLHRYDAEITPLGGELDDNAEDNHDSAFVRVRGKTRALVIDGEGKTGFVAGALQAADFNVREGALSALPQDVAGMAAYDVIVFGDVAAPDLDPAQIEALASYVRDLGGGLWLLGGDRSMGPGGYSGSALEEISPVSFDLKQERRRASLAEVIGIDISGSMAATVGGRTKLELANEAAVRSATILGPGDMLGVQHVDTVVAWSVPLAPLNDMEAVEKAIRSVAPGGGGILVDVTLRAAYAALAGVQVNLKHVLLFADGADAEEITPELLTEVRRAHGAGITTSCVALGRGPDLGALERISQLGGGRFYLVDDASRLAAVFAQETVLASRSALVEEPFQVAPGGGSSVTAGIDFAAAPPLDGYVVTLEKGRTSTLLRGPEEDPVLAYWTAGVGRSAAFTSDLKDRWGAAWTTWPGAARLVAQMARFLSRVEDDNDVRLQTQIAGGQLSVRADVVDDDGRAQTYRRLTATITGPGGFRQDVPLEPAGPGLHTATVALSRPGAYVTVAREDGEDRALATAGAALTRGEEMRATGSDLGLLLRIAELTGGRRRDTLAGVFTDRAARRFAYEEITRLLLALAAACLLATVATRRLALSETLGRLAARWRVSRAGRRAPDEPAAAPLAHVLRAKRRARTEAPPPAPPSPPASAVEQPAPKRPPPPAPRPPPTAAEAATPPPEERTLSAAEILVARRKRRRR